MDTLIIANQSDLQVIADAIRSKTLKTDKLSISQMAAEINSIVASIDGSNVGFGGDGTQSGSYSIPSEILNAIVAEIQKMSGRTNPLTPEEMLYWLRRVAYIPQGNAESVYAIGNSSFASGIIPAVVRGIAISTQSIYSTNNAVGSLVESA